MYQSNKQPAVWTKANDHFATSDGGSVKPDGEAFEGRVSYINLETAEHILNNIDSFRKAVDQMRDIKLKKLAGKELMKLKVQFIKSGLSPEQAEQAVQAILANKKTA